ncbi:MAG: tail fiber protein [Pseudomonadales bacterium]|nr:tail fiber protein [Pseudomonadales bacterium]
MSEPYLGEIRLFPYNFAPKDWALCDGQLLNVQDYPALFSLLGDKYGGNGTTTFAVPDYRGKTPLNWGTAPWRNFNFGSKGGSESQVLSEVPPHTHSFSVVNKTGDQNEPQNRYLAANVETSSTPNENFYSHSQENTSLNPAMVADAGATAPNSFSNIQPFQVLNFCIALEGLYPPRS